MQIWISSAAWGFRRISGGNKEESRKRNGWDRVGNGLGGKRNGYKM